MFWLLKHQCILSYHRIIKQTFLTYLLISKVHSGYPAHLCTLCVIFIFLSKYYWWVAPAYGQCSNPRGCSEFWCQTGSYEYNKMNSLSIKKNYVLNGLCYYSYIKHLSPFKIRLLTTIYGFHIPLDVSTCVGHSEIV